MILIKRVKDEKYILETPDGETIEEYETQTMQHPTDWRQDAANAGYPVFGSADWRFVDERNL